MLNQLDKQQYFMKIVESLEDSAPYYEVANKVLGYMEAYLNTSHAYIIQKSVSNHKYDVLIQYDRDDALGEVHYIEADYLKICMDHTSYVNNDQNIFARELELLRAKECIISPIKVNNNLIMYLLILDRDRIGMGQEEVDFVHSASLILQVAAQKKLFSKSLFSTNEILRSILSNIGSGVIVYDMHNRTTLFANAIAEHSDENRRVLSDAMMHLMRDEEGVIPKRPVEYFDADSGLWFDVHFTKLRWIDEREVVLITSNDNTLKKKNSTKSTFQAQNDFLTGLYNRMKCENDLKKVLETSMKCKQKGAVLFIDMDNFKNINDSLGHDYGDELLKEIGVVLQGVTGLHNHCYRMGGDEFVAIVTPENFYLYTRIINRILTEFNKPWYLIDTECYCTMSMGVVIFPDNGQDVSSLIKKADIAMYEAKKSGKNRHFVYDEKMNKSGSYRRLEVESNMRQAVEEQCEEFVVFYQPIIDAQTNECYGCESLIRWNSKVLGFMNPGEFIPLAEYLGLINDLGDFVLKSACEQCKEWNDKYNPEFRINVNLSVVQLLQRNVVEHVEEIINATGVNPANITLEITENLAINDIERVKNIITGLKSIGVRIALDDFGTGYSSLNYIKQLDFDVIKIDKTFVDDILKDEYERAFVKLIVDFSRQIDVQICAEGVETEEQSRELKALGTNCLQGYLFSKPLPAEQFEQLFFGKENQ